MKLGMTLEDWENAGYKFKQWRLVNGELRPEFIVQNIKADLGVIIPGTIIRIGKRIWASIK